MSRDLSPPSSPLASGRFIVFEGGDGSGKSTQAQVLATRLGAVLTREPGGTPIGKRVRELVLDPTLVDMSDRTEALLMAADRAQHVDELVRPALSDGRHVVSDRHVPSSIAYQGVGRGLGVDPVLTVNRFAVGDLLPDLIILLEADPNESRSRLGDDLDRIEHAGTDLAAIVAATYRELAADDPQRWAIIDAQGTIDDVSTRVDLVVSDRLGL